MLHLGGSRPCENKKCGAKLNPGDRKVCSRCKSAVYCGRACQKADWATHKVACDVLVANPEKTKKVHQERKHMHILLNAYNREILDAYKGEEEYSLC